MDCTTIDQLRKEIQRHLLGSRLGSTDNSRLSIDVISQNILHHWPNSPEKLSQFWEDLELNDRLLQRLITHDDAWVGRFFPLFQSWSKENIKKMLVSPSLDGNWSLHVTQKLFVIPEFKKQFVFHFKNTLETFITEFRYGVINNRMDFDDLLWLQDVSNMPLHIRWKMVGQFLKSHDAHMVQLARQWTLSLPKIDGWNRFVFLEVSDFTPLQLDLKWLRSWEDILGPYPSLQKNKLFHDLFLDIKESIAAKLLEMACDEWPNVVVNSKNSFKDVNSVEYVKNIQQFWTMWMTDEEGKKDCLASLSGVIRPCVVEAVLSYVLTADEMDVLLSREERPNVFALPSVQRHMLSKHCADMGQSPATSKRM